MPGRGSYTRRCRTAWLIVGIANARTRILQGAVGQLVSCRGMLVSCRGIAKFQNADPTRHCETALNCLVSCIGTVNTRRLILCGFSRRCTPLRLCRTEEKTHTAGKLWECRKRIRIAQREPMGCRRVGGWGGINCRRHSGLNTLLLCKGERGGWRRMPTQWREHSCCYLRENAPPA
jgi:hypothetical protein